MNKLAQIAEYTKQIVDNLDEELYPNMRVGEEVWYAWGAKRAEKAKITSVEMKKRYSIEVSGGLFGPRKELSHVPERALFMNKEEAESARTTQKRPTMA